MLADLRWSNFPGAAWHVNAILIGSSSIPLTFTVTNSKKEQINLTLKKTKPKNFPFQRLIIKEHCIINRPNKREKENTMSQIFVPNPVQNAPAPKKISSAL